MPGIPVPYLTPPAELVNEALDLIGADEEKILGDITDGTRVAEAARRSYGRLLRLLLRTAHWSFARVQTRLTLLGDATGNSSLPVISDVENPWAFAYAWPTDAVQGRWMPWNPIASQPLDGQGVPLTTGVSAIANYNQVPGRFLVSSSSLYPIEVGVVNWDQIPDLQRTEGLGPVYRKVILTDCACAHFVYTRLVTTVEEWDAGFREAFVTLLAMRLAPTAIDDRREADAQRDRLIPIAQNMIADARVMNGNESTTSASVDHQPIWISARNSYWGGYPGNDATLYTGYTYYPWDSSMSWCGSVF